MSLRPVRLAAVLASASWHLVGAAAPVDDATAVAMARPHELIVAGDLTPAQRDAILAPIANCTASGTTAARSR